MTGQDDPNLPQISESYSPEDWLTASKTLRLVTNATLSRTSHITICTRAYAGLIRARAQRLIVGTETRDEQFSRWEEMARERVRERRCWPSPPS